METKCIGGLTDSKWGAIPPTTQSVFNGRYCSCAECSNTRWELLVFRGEENRQKGK